MRRFLLRLALFLAVLGGPAGAWAQSYQVKDGVGNLLQFGAINYGGNWFPEHVQMGLTGGVPTPLTAVGGSLSVYVANAPAVSLASVGPGATAAGEAAILAQLAAGLNVTCVSGCSGGGGGGGGAVTAVSGAYALGAIVDLGTGSSPAANTTNGYLKSIDGKTPAPTLVSNAPAAIALTTGGTWYQALASNAGRKGCLVQNASGSTMYLYVGDGTPGAATAFQIGYPGGTFDCAHPGGAVLTDQIRVMNTVSSSAAVVVSQ